MNEQDRRQFLEALGVATGAVVLAPVVSACNRQAEGEPTTPPAGDVAEAPPRGDRPAEADPLAIPTSRPEDWDAIAFNRDRGNAGAIPESYRPSINGEDGVTHHLGKHLPYVPALEDRAIVPTGFLALMFGNADVGYARHPANARNAEGLGAHWFDRIALRKAIDDEAEESLCEFTGWPEPGEGDRGRYAVFGGGEITADGGRNTIYLVPLPGDVGPGDVVRVVGHCINHGEYVDFVTVPAA